MLPLENIKILDLSRLAAGNMVSHMFADFGADVVKVEKPGKGDDLRNWKINGISHWWAVYSRNKRSISIDLKKNKGLELLKELVKTADVFIVNCVSDEFIKNEIKNVFGHTEKIFSGSIEASQIIRKLVRDKKYLGSKKRMFLEQTINKQRLVIPNWRPIDVIYWVAERSVRKSKKGGVLQNGFNFWESALGFHFKSIDKMIDDVNEQKEETTDHVKGKPALYTYTYSPKGMKVDAGEDQYKICLLYTSPSPRDGLLSRMPSSA